MIESINLKPLNQKAAIHYGGGMSRLALLITPRLPKCSFLTAHAMILADLWYPNIESQFKV
jgi:hypothetical protein